MDRLNEALASHNAEIEASLDDARDELEALRAREHELVTLIERARSRPRHHPQGTPHPARGNGPGPHRRRERMDDDAGPSRRDQPTQPLQEARRVAGRVEPDSRTGQELRPPLRQGPPTCSPPRPRRPSPNTPGSHAIEIRQPARRSQGPERDNRHTAIHRHGSDRRLPPTVSTETHRMVGERIWGQPRPGSLMALGRVAGRRCRPRRRVGSIPAGRGR